MKRPIHFITYGEGDGYDITLNRICKEAEESNFFDSIETFNYNRLTANFKEKYKNVLRQPRGAGYWIWKVDIIKNNEHESIVKDKIMKKVREFASAV